jgi:hypothetical protein
VEAEMAEPVVPWKTVAWINDDKHSGCLDMTVIQATLSFTNTGYSLSGGGECQAMHIRRSLAIGDWLANGTLEAVIIWYIVVTCRITRARLFRPLSYQW